MCGKTLEESNKAELLRRGANLLFDREFAGTTIASEESSGGAPGVLNWIGLADTFLLIKSRASCRSSGSFLADCWTYGGD